MGERSGATRRQCLAGGSAVLALAGNAGAAPAAAGAVPLPVAKPAAVEAAVFRRVYLQK